VIACGDEITADGNIGDMRQRALEGYSACGVGFDD
jgi:hypothetical protein